MSPVLGHVSPERQVIEGHSITLSCVVVLGTPKPEIAWFKDGKPLIADSRTSILNDGNGLVITNADSDDSGIYQW